MNVRAQLVAACLLAAPAPRFARQSAGFSLQNDADVFSHVIVPQRRALTVAAGFGAVAIDGVDARVNIVEQIATTRLDVRLRNAANAIAEAVLLLPVPDGATVRSFDFQGTGVKPSARLMPADEARRVYESIVQRTRDPALLEFAGYRMVRSSVFPVPARGEQRVSIVYEQVLKADGERVDYLLPRSEAVDAAAAPWTIEVTVKSGRGLSTIYSPSHAVSVKRGDPSFAFVELEQGAGSEPGSFMLSFLTAVKGVNGSLMACPDEKGAGGWFLWLAGVPPSAEIDGGPPIARELTVVIDRSGSMAGEKMEQAREAARQVLEGLRAGEWFNVIDYSDQIARFAQRPVAKSEATMSDARRYLKALEAKGGTNLNDALVAAVAQPATEGALPMVLFLTDGLPTFGVTGESEIRANVAKANAGGRRIFTFGVGNDVNAPLLDGLAQTGRGSTVYVQAKENVEVRVGQVAKRLAEPVLTQPRLETIDMQGNVSTRLTRDVVPAELGDLFAGDQCLVLGRYVGAEPFRLRLTGERRGEARSFTFDFDPRRARPENSFVGRLWASRRIATLIDEVRQAGAKGAASQASVLLADPKLGETVSEIVALSTRFGVLTEYTSFFATEGTDLAKPDKLRLRVANALAKRAQQVREGRQAVAQSTNIRLQRQQRELNRRNAFLDDNLQPVRLADVQQMGDRTLYRRYAQWVDSDVLEAHAAASSQPAPAAPAPQARVVDFGTPEYFALLTRLLGEGRQGLLALEGNLRLRVDGQTVIVRVN